MTIHGTFIRGVVVPDQAPDLPDGTRVQIQMLEPAEPRASAPRHFHPVGSWEGPPGEFDRLLGEVQRMRDEDMTFADDRDDTMAP